MGKYILDIPDKIHDELRHRSVDDQKEMKELILEGIKMRLTQPKKTKTTIPKGESTIVFQVRLWSPAHKKYKERLEHYKGKKSFFNIYDGVLRLQRLKLQDHFHSPGEMMNLMEEWYRRYVDLKLEGEKD